LIKRSRQHHRVSCSRMPLRSLYAEVLDEAVPPARVQAARNAGAARESARQSWRIGGMAAGVILAFGAGRQVRCHAIHS